MNSLIDLYCDNDDFWIGFLLAGVIMELNKEDVHSFAEEIMQQVYGNWLEAGAKDK